MKLFYSFDDREIEIENAAGNRAYKVLWVLTMIAISIAATLKMRGMHISVLFESIALMTLLSMFISLCVKYWYCWTRHINKKIIVRRFVTSIFFTIVLLLILMKTSDIFFF